MPQSRGINLCYASAVGDEGLSRLTEYRMFCRTVCDGGITCQSQSDILHSIARLVLGVMLVLKWNLLSGSSTDMGRTGPLWTGSSPCCGWPAAAFHLRHLVGRARVLEFCITSADDDCLIDINNQVWVLRHCFIPVHCPLTRR
jgi:hypothetical protein